MPLRFFASSRTLYSLENTLPSKLRPKQFLISYSGKKLQRCHCQKQLPSLLSSQQHFAGIFASEPMTLPEIDHVSFLVEPVKEDPCKRIQHCCAKLWRSRNKRNVGSCWLKSLTGFKLCATTLNNIQQHATGCANGRTM